MEIPNIYMENLPWKIRGRFPWNSTWEKHENFMETPWNSMCILYEIFMEHEGSPWSFHVFVQVESSRKTFPMVILSWTKTYLPLFDILHTYHTASLHISGSATVGNLNLKLTWDLLPFTTGKVLSLSLDILTDPPSFNTLSHASVTHHTKHPAYRYLLVAVSTVSCRCEGSHVDHCGFSRNPFIYL